MKMLPVLAFVSTFVMGCLVPPSDDLPVAKVCDSDATQLCVYLGKNDEVYDGKQTCNDDGMSWGDCVPLDLPSIGQGGSGGATDTGGSGGSTAVECTTDDDCAAFNSVCLVYECKDNACFAFERDDDGDGSSLCGGNAPGMFDCDDTNPNIKPGAEEVCGDLVDNNCNGKVDEGCFDFCQPFPN